MNISRLTKKEKPAAKKLWRDVFTEDTDAFIDFYFDEEFDDDIYFGVFEDENLVSMVGLTNISIRFNETNKNTFLFRGVATDNAHTGKGYASALMIHAMSYLKSQNVSFVLLKTFIHPFYKKLGFATCSYTEDEKVAPKELKKDITGQILSSMKSVDPLLLEKLYQLYIAFIQNKNLFVVRTKEAFHKHLYEAIDISNEQLLVLFENDMPVAYSLCESRKDALYSEETVFSSREELSFFAEIAKNANQTDYIYKNVIGTQSADAMSRVLNVEDMLKELSFTTTAYIQIEDALFADNAGLWKIEIIGTKKSVEKVAKSSEGVPNIAFSISTGELSAYLLGEAPPANIAAYFKANQLHGIFEQY